VTSRRDPLQKLLGYLSLETLDADLYLGDPGPGEGRLFGGMVAAQSVIAAGMTVEKERPLHSLHAYFLRPGRHDAPIRFVVHRIRDGRSFTTRRVVAHQAGEAIFNLAASYALPEDGIEHQDPAPQAPPPEACEDWELARARVLGDARFERESAAEVRISVPYHPEKPGPARQSIWVRLRGTPPDDPMLQTALLVYMSDRTLASTAARPHGTAVGHAHDGEPRPRRLDPPPVPPRRPLDPLRQREPRRPRRARHHLRRHVPGRRAHRVGRAGSADPGAEGLIRTRAVLVSRSVGNRIAGGKQRPARRRTFGACPPCRCCETCFPAQRCWLRAAVRSRPHPAPARSSIARTCCW
jgi:acyl-CoA thioesterase-2